MTNAQVAIRQKGIEALRHSETASFKRYIIWYLRSKTWPKSVKNRFALGVCRIKWQVCAWMLDNLEGA